MAPENSFSYSSILAKKPQKADFELVQPERVQAYELGYRGIFKGISVDLSGYYNKYIDFIGNKTVVVPYYGKADLSDITPLPPQLGGSTPTALIALFNGDYKPFQVYTNSKADVASYGIGISLTKEIFKDYELGVNYVWSKFDFDQASDPDYSAGFNTPEHKFKASFGSPHVYKDLGFNVNFRWNNEYLWESSFIDGIVPANSVVDAQVNYTIRKWKSIIKIGAANIGGHEYFSAPGTGHIGSQYYATWTVNI